MIGLLRHFFAESPTDLDSVSTWTFHLDLKPLMVGRARRFQTDSHATGYAREPSI